MMRKAWCSTEDVPYSFPRSSIKFQNHTGQKIADFDRNWASPDCNSSLNSSMASKWYTKLDVIIFLYRRGALLFSIVIHQISRSHRTKQPPILTWIEHFRTVASVWIYWWIWNDAQSLMLHRRGALLFFEVIHQISRSHGLKHRWFGSNLSKITRLVAAIKSLRFALFYYN